MIITYGIKAKEGQIIQELVKNDQQEKYRKAKQEMLNRGVKLYQTEIAVPKRKSIKANGEVFNNEIITDAILNEQEL